MNYEYDWDGEVYSDVQDEPQRDLIYLIPPLVFVVVGLWLGLMLFLVDIDFTGVMGDGVDSLQAELAGTLAEEGVPTEGSTAASWASVAASNGVIAPFFAPSVQYWSDSILGWSEQTGLDPDLIATVMQIESCGDPFAQSSAGAMGLFQVMPFHFEDGEDPFQPETNAKRGLDYLQRALAARDGAVRYGLAGYNAGITGASRAEYNWPAETQRYVYWGTGIYAEAQEGRATSDRLNVWLDAGGSSLCRQAEARLGLK